MYKQIHSKEKEQFIKLFQQQGIDNIDDRFRILDVFLQAEKHISVEEFTMLLDKYGYQLDFDLIKDTLDLMCEYGFAQKTEFKDRQVLYEHRNLGLHHDHMVCTKCNKIIEFTNEQIEQLQSQVASSLGFHMLQHKMEIYGLCSDCTTKRSPLMPLMFARQGERLIIRELKGGAEFQKRLMEIGLRLGDEIGILTRQGRGEFVIAADLKRFILGRGMTEKIYVELCK